MSNLELNIRVLSHAGEMNPEMAKDKVVVVIDVLRATSVMLTALNNGVKRIFPYSDIDEARCFFSNLKEKDKLLCGERAAERPYGFDLGNSPLDYKKAVVQNKLMVMTTSNGTRAIQNSEGARKLYIGAYLNLEALVEVLLNSNSSEIILLCSGTQNRFSLDDALCAGAIIRRLQNKVKCNVDDLGSFIVSSLPEKDEDVIHQMSECMHYNLLKSKSLDKDLVYCFSVDKIQLVPEFKNGFVTI
ncbi:MAG: 2-phosphosulfolactate phosphatase [Bacteroidales bacterium]